MPTLRVDAEDPEREPIARAAAIILRGGLVAFPTETVYGLGANALDDAAVARLYAAKGRPHYNPLIAHVADARGARTLVERWPDTADRLAAAFWPGPLTLVLPKSPRVPERVSAGLATIAVRVPAHPVALALLQAAAVPIVAPSANPSTAVSPTRAEHVEKALGQRVDLILDGGATAVGIESTVVDLSGERPMLLRPGALSTDELEPYVGELELPGPVTGAAARLSPGMMERHYAPRAEVRLFHSSETAEAMSRARRKAEAGGTVGALLRTEAAAAVDSEPLQHVVRMPTDAAGYARDLYAVLHRLDALGCDLILVEAVPSAPPWAGIRDRLRRASESARG